jgi:hypothetical protein
MSPNGLPNITLQLTRLACPIAGVPRPPQCARIGGALPEPLGKRVSMIS